MKNTMFAALVVAMCPLSFVEAATAPAPVVCPSVISAVDLENLRFRSSITEETAAALISSGRMIVITETLLQDAEFLRHIRDLYDACLKALLPTPVVQ